jgi:hypothetical protein
VGATGPRASQHRAGEDQRQAVGSISPSNSRQLQERWVNPGSHEIPQTARVSAQPDRLRRTYRASWSSTKAPNFVCPPVGSREGCRHGGAHGRPACPSWAKHVPRVAGTWHKRCACWPEASIVGCSLRAGSSQPFSPDGTAPLVAFPGVGDVSASVPTIGEAPVDFEPGGVGEASHSSTGWVVFCGKRKWHHCWSGEASHSAIAAAPAVGLSSCRTEQRR